MKNIRSSDDSNGVNVQQIFINGQVSLILLLIDLHFVVVEHKLINLISFYRFGTKLLVIYPKILN